MGKWSRLREEALSFLRRIMPTFTKGVDHDYRSCLTRGVQTVGLEKRAFSQVDYARVSPPCPTPFVSDFDVNVQTER